MENFNLSHQDNKLIDEFINTLRDEYYSLFENGYGKIKVRRWKAHEHLGMTFYYCVKVQLNITIMYYIKEMMEFLDKAETKVSGTKSSAAPMNLFVVY